jgi:hypothetical protein
MVFNSHAKRAVSGSFVNPSRTFSITVSHTYPFLFGEIDDPLYFNNTDITELIYHSRHSGFISGIDGEPLTVHSLKAITPASLVFDYTSFADGTIRLQSGSEALEGSFIGTLVLSNVVVTTPNHMFTVISDYNTGGSFTLIPALSNLVGPSLYLDIRGRDWSINIPDGLATTAPLWPGTSHVELKAVIRPSSYNQLDTVKFNYLNDGKNSIQTAITLNTYSHTASAAVFETASHMSIDEHPLAKIDLYGGTFSMAQTKLQDTSTASHQISGITLDGHSLLDLRVGSELEMLTIPSLKIKDSTSSKVVFSAHSVVSVAY